MSGVIENVHYFNNAGQAELSPDVQQVGLDCLQTPPWRGQHDRATSSLKRVRQLYGRLIGVTPLDDEGAKDGDDNGFSTTIAIMPSTAFAITLAARNLQRTILTKDDSGRRYRILVLQDQFDSAVYPWQQVCEESHGRVRLDIIPYPDEENGWTKAILRNIQRTDVDSVGTGEEERILAACLPPLHWSNGTLLDLEAIGAACQERKIPLIVDGTQAVGVIPTCDVKKIRPAMLACSAHKWLRGPIGCCLVYISPCLYTDWLPLDFHGRGRDFAGGTAWDASKNEMSPKGYPDQFFSDARKFDSGGKTNPITLPMLHASLEKIVLLDMEEIQIKLQNLMEPLFSWVKESGGRFSISGPEPRAYHLIGVVPRDRTPAELIEITKRLEVDNRIILAVRCGCLRVSPYLTNIPDDVSKLVEALQQLA